MFHRSKKDILNGNIAEQILLFTFALLWSYLLQQVYEVADKIIVGRYVGKTALAAFGGSASMIINILVNFICGIASGIMVVVAQSYGNHNYEKVNKAVRTGMFMCVSVGGLLTIVSCLSSKQLLLIMNCPPETIHDSLIYMNMYFLSFIPYMIFTVGTYVLRATGDSKRPLIFTAIVAIVKITLGFILTAYFNIGIWGVAISTFVAYFVCAIVTLILFSNTPDCYRCTIKEFGFDTQDLKEIFKIGLPIAIQNVLFAFSNALIQIKINIHGTDSIAAFSAFNSVDNYFWLFSNTIGAATITIAGQNYGNKNMKRVHETVRYGLLIELIASIIIGSANYFLGKYTLSMYTSDINVINIGSEMLKVVAVAYWTYIFVEIISCTCKGCGDATNSMIISLIGICVVRTIYLFMFNFDNAVQVLYCYPISWVITTLIFIIYFCTNKRYKLTKHD